VTSRETVLILDFGSQYTQLIARRVREQRVYCEIQPCNIAFEKITAMKPRAVILSGGPASVYGEGAPQVDKRVFELRVPHARAAGESTDTNDDRVPVLGICYGVQLMAHLLGGKVEGASEREYGAAKVKITKPIGVLHRFAEDETIDVWMSHGDRIASMPEGFITTGLSDNTPFCAVADEKRRIYGVQFHPEVAHTPQGAQILAAFLFDVAKLEPSWTPGTFSEEAVAAVKATVGATDQAICGLSGGVDSSVAAVICHRALGDRLTCIFVDNGVLRKGEFEQVAATFRETFHMKLIAVDARDRFLSALAGVSDPEQKRKIIGRVFIEVFEDEAKKVQNARFLVQGTLYPDVIESVSSG